MVYDGKSTSLSFYLIESCFILYPIPLDTCLNQLINNQNQFDYEYEGEIYIINPIMYQLTEEIDREVQRVMELQDKIQREQLYNDLYGLGDIVIPEFG